MGTNIKMLYANINSYSPKNHLINHYLQNTNIDCLMCVETKNKEYIRAYRDWNIIQLKGNIANVNIRGGCLTQAKKNLQMGKENPPRINNLKNNCLHLTFPYHNSKLHIFLVYIDNNSTIEETIFTKACLYEYSIIIGDFNPNTARKKNQLRHFLNNSNFMQIHTPPTFIMPNNPNSTPDVFMCTENIRNNITDVELISDLGSDHLAIQFKLYLQNNPTPHPIETIPNISKCNIDVVNEKMLEFIENRHEAITPLYITQFNEELTKLILENSPTQRKHFFNYKLPPFILNLIKQKRILYRQIKRNEDHEIKTKYNELTKDIHTLIQQYKQDKWLNACKNINEARGRTYWSEIKKLSKYKSNISSTPEMVYNNNIYYTDQEKSSTFKDYFEETYKFTINDNFDNTNLNLINEWYDNFFNTDPLINDDDNNTNITEEEYYNTLSSGKNTAPGHDFISRNTLRKLEHSIHLEIINIYNYCLKNHHFPTEWKTGIIITIPKPNQDHSHPQNYRPITLLPVIGKNLEKILKKRLSNEIDQHIPQNQFGFRQKSSTIHPLVIITSNVQASSIIGSKSAAIFIDLTKAFDSVWHRGLLYKLHHANCPIYMLWLLKEFLEGRKTRIKINTSVSDTFTNEQGVPQGSPLSPFLFNIFCYDILPNERPANHNKSYLLQFADDIAWVAHGKTLRQTMEALQHSANNTIRWCNNWRLKINPDKSQLIIFNNRISEATPTIQIINNILSPSATVKYLGIKLDNKLNFNSHTKDMKRKMISRAKHFRSLTYKNEGISMTTATKIYKMICRPIIEYGSILFSTCRKPALNNIEVAERSSIRRITKIRHPHNSLHNIRNNLLYERTGIEPILIRFRKLSKKYAQSEEFHSTIQPFTIQIPEDVTRRRTHPERTLLEVLSEEQ